MAEIKAHEFDAFLKRRLGDHRLFLVYGPDRGLVSERAEALAVATKVDLKDAFSFMRLEAGTLSGDPGRLYDEARSTGLFGGDKLIWIKGAGADKGLADAVASLGADKDLSTWIIIEAGDLKKGANLRKSAEASPGAMAIPCYADDARALSGLIDEELSAFNLKITADARTLLVELLGGDRLASRGEIRKLALYAMGRPTIEADDVAAVIGDASAISTDDAVDAVLKGDRNAFLHATQKVIASKTPVFLVIQGVMRQLQLIDLMRADMDERRSSAADAIATHGRHLHFRRKPVVEAALRAWTGDLIARELNRLHFAILQCRRRNSLEDTIALQTLLATTLIAGRSKQARN